MGLVGEVLPDSRPINLRGARLGPGGVYWVPVYCANCGCDGGLTPEESTFLFYLCTKCAETYGEIAGTLMMPDQVFWEKLKQEQLEAYGRYLTEQELVQVVAEDASPLATLIKEGR